MLMILIRLGLRLRESAIPDDVLVLRHDPVPQHVVRVPRVHPVHHVTSVRAVLAVRLLIGHVFQLLFLPFQKRYSRIPEAQSHSRSPTRQSSPRLRPCQRLQRLQPCQCLQRLRPRPRLRSSTSSRLQSATYGTCTTSPSTNGLTARRGCCPATCRRSSPPGSPRNQGTCCMDRG